MEKRKDNYVAFMDLMGFADFVRGESHGRVGEYLSALAGFAEALNVAGLGIGMRIFSDSVVLNLPDDGKPDTYHKFLLYVCNLQLAALTAPGLGTLPLRGSVTKGAYAADGGKLTYGRAPVDAYEMENRMAVYPRILVSPEDYKPENVRALNLNEKAITVRRDFDGLLHLNYLSAVYGTSGKWIPQGNQYAGAHKELIQRNIEKHKGDKRVLAKYEWMKNYHNWFCGGIEDLAI